MDDAVRAYIEAIPPEHRPTFDRLHGLVMQAYPDAVVTLSYAMPTYRVGGHRLYLGTWRHGVSVYGWRQGGEAGFIARHPELKAGKGTIRLRSGDAEGISDEEFTGLIQATLSGRPGSGSP